jgi:hypothetical protein
MNAKMRFREAPIIKFPRWRGRTWSFLIWTATVALLAVLTASPSANPCAPDDFYCNVGAGADDAANAAILGGLLFIVWPLGLVVIWAFATFCARPSAAIDQAPGSES